MEGKRIPDRARQMLLDCWRDAEERRKLKDSK